MTKSLYPHHHYHLGKEESPQSLEEDPFLAFIGNLLSQHFEDMYRDENTGYFHIKLDHQSAVVIPETLEVNCEDKDLKKRLETLLTRGLSCLEPL